MRDRSRITAIIAAGRNRRGVTLTAAGSAMPVGWVSLDRADNDPLRFWSYVITALDTLAPGVGTTALALLQSPQPPPPEALLTTLLNEITIIPEPFVLVLDEREDGVARQPVFGRHALHFALPQSDKAVFRGGKHGAVCVGYDAAEERIALKVQRELLDQPFFLRHAVAVRTAGLGPVAERDAPGGHLIESDGEEGHRSRLSRSDHDGHGRGDSEEDLVYG